MKRLLWGYNFSSSTNRNLFQLETAFKIATPCQVLSLLVSQLCASELSFKNIPTSVLALCELCVHIFFKCGAFYAVELLICYIFFSSLFTWENVGKSCFQALSLCLTVCQPQRASLRHTCMQRTHRHSHTYFQTL